MGNHPSKKTFSHFLKKYPGSEYYEFEFEANWTHCFREGGAHMYNIEDKEMFDRVKTDPMYILFDNLNIVQIPKYVLGRINLSTAYNKTQKVIVPKSKVNDYTKYLKKNNITSKNVYVITLSDFMKNSHLFNNK